LVPIVSVQNRFNLTDRSSEAVLTYCEANQLGFIPWYPIASGSLAQPGGVLGKLSAATGATASQLALAWLLRRSPVMLPIPGTSTTAHLEENCGAAQVQLSDAQFKQLSAAA
jgi:aryl-alcohol dehydrogenase-like predicted oxidoreductase